MVYKTLYFKFFYYWVMGKSLFHILDDLKTRIDIEGVLFFSKGQFILLTESVNERSPFFSVNFFRTSYSSCLFYQIKQVRL